MDIHKQEERNLSYPINKYPLKLTDATATLRKTYKNAARIFKPKWNYLSIIQVHKKVTKNDGFNSRREEKGISFKFVTNFLILLFTFFFSYLKKFYDLILLVV